MLLAKGVRDLQGAAARVDAGVMARLFGELGGGSFIEPPPVVPPMSARWRVLAGAVIVVIALVAGAPVATAARVVRVGVVVSAGAAMNAIAAATWGAAWVHGVHRST